MLGYVRVGKGEGGSSRERGVDGSFGEALLLSGSSCLREVLWDFERWVS